MVAKAGGNLTRSVTPNAPTLTVVNQLPQANLVGYVEFTYTIPANTFSFPNPKINVYKLDNATRTIPSDAPDWLHVTGQDLWGTPSDFGNTFILVEAKGKGSQRASTVLTMLVEELLSVAGTIDAQTAHISTPYLLHFDPGVLFDGPAISTYSVGEYIGNSTVTFTSLPGWLTYENSNTTIYGTPNNTSNSLNIIIRAFSNYGQHADKVFSLTVSA